VNKKTFQKTAGEMAEYIGHTQSIIDNLKSENAQLRAQSSLNKTASNRSPAVDVDSVENMVDNAIEAGFIKEANRKASIDAVVANPGSLIGFVDKLATNGIEKTASAVRPLGRPTAAATKPANPAVRESDRLFEERFNGLASRY